MLPRTKNQASQNYINYNTQQSHSYVQPYSTLTSLNSQTNTGLIESLGMAPKINQIINSVYAMNHAEMESQLRTCAKIVSQLLQNNFIGMATPGAVKLICYELVLMIAEQQSAGSYAIDKMRDGFEKNRDLQLNVSIKNTLAAINQIIEQMMWNQSKRKRGYGDSLSPEMEGIHRHYTEFKALLSQLDRKLSDNSHPEEEEDMSRSEISVNKNQRLNLELLKAQEEQSKQKQQEYEALIEQLEQIVAKKEKRIKQINEQMQENIIQQKNLESVVEQLENRLYESSEQIKELNDKLQYSDRDTQELQIKINQLMEQNASLQRDLKANQSRKPPRQLSSEKNMRNSKQTPEKMKDSKRNKTQMRDILFEDDILGGEKSMSNTNPSSGDQDLIRMLYTQAVSIEQII